MSPARSNDTRQSINDQRNQLVAAASLKQQQDGLDPRALYIVTQPLINGRFHWSLMNLDSNGGVIQHQWHEYHGGRTAEKYSVRNIDTGSIKSKKINALAYFKIGGYTPIEEGRFDECCRRVFKRSYGTVQENREHDITPKTWLLLVLEMLMREGVIVRSGSVKDLECIVIALSREKERQFLEAFLKQQPYVAPILEI
ncbi:hypothetical protein ONZ45_g7449 [Pleurotus djamor]|nr:hypothetical protein ONZ45_g7449 [Pleurotus djamor]